MNRARAATLVLVIGMLAPSASVAQQPGRARSLLLGATAFAGGTWQPSGIEVGLSRPGGRRGESLALMLRLGSFVQDQAVLIGTTTGFFTWALVGYRREITDLMAIGSERNPSFLRLVGSVEVGGALNLNSPLPQGGGMATLAALAGVSYGAEYQGGGNFTILAGPALFVGSKATGHTQVTLRFQSPLGRR